ncbi:MAG TPA: hypothetical protein VGZ71_16200, partial [Puia sp.]|nr:hypothetical protein [Puia sp.]
MKKIILLITGFAFYLIGNAQTPLPTISGNVNDEKQKAIESATVSLLKAKDSGLIKLAICDKDGKYVFENI